MNAHTMEDTSGSSFITVKRGKSDERRRSQRCKSMSIAESRLSDSKVPELVIPLLDLPLTMSLDSISPTAHSSMTLSPDRIESHSMKLLRRSSSGSNQAGSREKINYTKHQDGLLHRNMITFDGVDFCFRCNARVANVSDLTKSIEKTGYKLNGSEQIPVYRTIFLCTECLCWFKKEKTFKKTSCSDGESSIPCIRITSDALSFFIDSK